MELVFTAGTMVRGMTENGKKTKLKELELILGLMVVSTEVNGSTTIWTESVSTLGLMGECIKVIGGEASSMVLAATLYPAHR